MRHLPNTSTGCFRLALFGKPRHWGQSECSSSIGWFLDMVYFQQWSRTESKTPHVTLLGRSYWISYIHTRSKKTKETKKLIYSIGNFLCNKIPCFAIMSKATSQAFSSYRWNRTVLSFCEGYRLTVFVSNGTVAVMAQRGVSLKSVLTCYEKNKMIFFFIWAVIDFLTINISWFLLNIKQHPSPISRKPQTVLNVWMAWIVCIVLFSYHKCACPMSRAIAATFWPRGRRALLARRPRGPNVKKWVENILACHGMEPNIQQNADGRRRIVVRTPCGPGVWYERHTDTEVAVEAQLGSQRSRTRAPWERSMAPIAVTQRGVFRISGDHTAIWRIPRSPWSQRGRRPVWRGLYRYKGLYGSEFVVMKIWLRQSFVVILKII